MSLPAAIRVRISPETAESIGLSAVVSQELATVELLGNILGVTGKDADRIAGVLRRGSIVVGASRFRWTPVEAESSDVVALLTRFPNPEPHRPFNAAACIEAMFREGPSTLPVSREAGEKRRFMKRRDFWTELMGAVGTSEYVDYSYREQADLYRWRPEAAAVRLVHEAAGLLAYSTLERRLRALNFNSVDLLVRR